MDAGDVSALRAGRRDPSYHMSFWEKAEMLARCARGGGARAKVMDFSQMRLPWAVPRCFAPRVSAANISYFHPQRGEGECPKGGIQEHGRAQLRRGKQ